MTEKHKKDNRIFDNGTELNLFGPGWIKTYKKNIKKTIEYLITVQN